MAASLYLGNMILNSVLRGQPFVLPSRIFVSLHTADPGNTGAGEITILQWPSYRRLDPADGDSMSLGFEPPVDKLTRSTIDLAYGLMDGVLAINITHFGLWDELVGGNCLIVDLLATAKIFYPGDDAAIPLGKLTVTVI